MKTLTGVAIVVGVGANMCALWFAASPTPTSQFFSTVTVVLLLFALAVSFLFLIVRVWRTKLRAAIPATATIVFCATLLISLRVGNFVEDRMFLSQLERYQAFVVAVESGELRPSPQGSLTPSGESAGLARRVWIQPDPSAPDRQALIFLTGGGFPVKHSGYVFLPSDTLPDDHRLGHLNLTHRVAPQWFRCWD